MKNLCILSVVVLVLNSCAQEVPVFNDAENYFIVGSIEKHDKTHDKYTCEYKQENWDGYKTAFIAPKGYWSVGDTVFIKPSKVK